MIRVFKAPMMLRVFVWEIALLLPVPQHAPVTCVVVAQPEAPPVERQVARQAEQREARQVGR